MPNIFSKLPTDITRTFVEFLTVREHATIYQRLSKQILDIVTHDEVGAIMKRKLENVFYQGTPAKRMCLGFMMQFIDRVQRCSIFTVSLLDFDKPHIYNLFDMPFFPSVKFNTGEKVYINLHTRRQTAELITYTVCVGTILTSLVSIPDDVPGSLQDATRPHHRTWLVTFDTGDVMKARSMSNITVEGMNERCNKINERYIRRIPVLGGESSTAPIVVE